MDIDFNSVEIPDLAHQIELVSFKPHFDGNYSSVYQAVLQDQLVAVKVIKEVYGAQVHTMERKLKRERTTWALLRHPNILPLLGFANDHELFQPFGALISPWRAQGNASQFLKDRGKDLTRAERLDIWKGVATGVQYLHQHTPVLVHGDLKLANVMMDDQHSPQICDFGLASIFLEEGHSGMTTTSHHTGTDRYLAYELVRDGDTVMPTVASDIFALGCIGLEFYFLQTPYENRRNNMQGRIIADIKAGFRPANPQLGCDPESQNIWNLLGQCWAHNPSQRPSAGDLLAALQFRGDDAQLSKHSSEGLKLTRKMTITSDQRVTHLGPPDPLPLAVTQSPAGIQTQTHTPEGDTGPTAFSMEIDTDRSREQSDPNSSRDQDPETVSFMGHDVDQEIPQGSRALDNTDNTIMEIDMNSGRQSAADASALPQIGTQSFTDSGPNNTRSSPSSSRELPYQTLSHDPHVNLHPLCILSADARCVTVPSGIEYTQERLKQVLGPSSPLANEALLMLLRLIIESKLTCTNEFEPTIASHYGEALLRLVRSMPDCPIDALQDGSNSILTIFVSYPGFRCLICGNSKKSMDSGIGCVRSHLNIKPYACHGEECKTCPRDRVVQRFHTAALLSDHCGEKSYTSTDQALTSLPPPNFADQTADIIMESDMNSGIQGGAAGPWSAGQSQQNQFVQSGIQGSANFPRRADSVGNVLVTARAVHQAGRSNLGMGSWPQDHTTGFQLPTERAQAAYGTYVGSSDGNGACSNLGSDLDNGYRQQPYNGLSLNLEQGDGTGAVGTGSFGNNNSNSNSKQKQKQQGRRNEVDERKLAEAFMPGSFRSDPALRFFLDLIRTCHFYQEDETEPLVGTPGAEQLFAQVRGRYPHDIRFTPRNDPGFSSQPLENKMRDPQSIFMLLTENNQCLICGAQKERTARVLGHVRSDIGHRPYHCTCEKCMQSANPRRFFSDNLLGDHLKGQQAKQECIYCHNLFRRGGMKRHVMSKHPEHAQGNQDNDDRED